MTHDPRHSRFSASVKLSPVPPYTLLIALMASPIIGIAIALILTNLDRVPKLRSWAWVPMAVGAAIAALAALLLRAQTLETLIGNWSPVSFTGVPLALRLNPAPLLVLAAWLTAYFIDALTAPELGASLFDRHPISSALIIPALALVAMADNLITLLVGLGAVDIFVAFLALRRKQAEREELTHLMFNGLSTAVLLVVVAAYYAAGNSLAARLVQLPDGFNAMIAIALLLRLRFVPFRTSPFAFRDLRSTASAAAGFMLMAQLPTFGINQLPVWFYLLGALSAITTLLVGILQESDASGDIQAMIVSASIYLSSAALAAGSADAVAAAGCAWLLGSALIAIPPISPNGQPTMTLATRVVRGVGAAALLGIPLLAGFTGQAGVMTNLAANGLIGVLTALIRLASFAALGYALIHVVLDPPAANEPAPSQLRPPRVLMASVVGALLLLATGLFTGVGSAAARNGVLGWLTWLIGLVVAYGLWRSEAVWERAIQPIGQNVVRAVRLDWLNELLSGTAARIRAPLPRVFDLLESDSALVWAVIVAMLLVLVTRPGGP